MQADRTQRLSTDNKSSQKPTQTIVTAIAVLILGVLAWLVFRDASEPGPEPVEQAAPEPAPTRETMQPIPPDIPVIADSSELSTADDAEESDAVDAPAEEEDTDVETASAAPEAPRLTLRNSDARLRERLGPELPGGMASDIMRNSNLVERGAAAIDSVRRGLVPDRLLNLKRPEGAFRTRTQGGQTVIDPQSFRRYDGMIDSLVSTPVEPVVSAFHQFRPLLEEAYGALGYAPDEADNALIAALDAILATPTIDGAIAVQQREAVWAYLREDLESLSLLQKQLLRTGPDNVRKVKEKARRLREALLTP